jgi:hypothetical protein
MRSQDFIHDDHLDLGCEWKDVHMDECYNNRQQSIRLEIVAVHFNDNKSRTFIMGYANQGLNIGLWHSALAPLGVPNLQASDLAPIY